MAIRKNQVVDRFNQGAATYDTAATIQRVIAERLASQLAGIQADTVLEIGCGTGLLSQHLSVLFPEASLLLTDIAEKMVEQCKQRFPHHPNITTAPMDGENLKVNQQFDLIVSSMALQWFVNLKQGMTNIFQQLTPRGRFIFALPGSRSLQEWHALCQAFHLPIATPLFPSLSTLKSISPDLKIEAITYQQDYPTAYLFLHSLKQLGSRATHADYKILNAGKLRQALRESEKQITITYEIFYGEYVHS